jgi:hypothetical protein
MTKSSQQASGSTSSGTADPLLEAMAAFSDEVFEATQRLLKAQQQMTRAVLGRGDQDGIARDEESADGQDRDDDELADEPLGEVDEADDDVEDEPDVVEDVTDDEAVDEADDEPPVGQIVPARAKAAAPAAGKRSTRGRRRSA